MAALDNATRLVMTILFVGTVSGANVFFYAKYGSNFPYTPMAHAVLFGLMTVGSIMVVKAMFDLFLNDKIELWLLDRKIDAFWSRKKRDSEQYSKMQESAKTIGMPFNQSLPMQNNSKTPVPINSGEAEISNEFLIGLQ